MRLIGNKLRAAARPFVRLWQRAQGVLPEMPDAPNGLIPRAAYNVGFFRTLTAPSWRTMVRWSVIGIGFCLYISLQLALAYMVNNLQWMFIIAFFIAAGCLTLTAARPTWAFLVWMALSPLGFIFLRLDFGAGMPAITFDRIAVLAIAGLLIVRAMLERNRIRKPILGEWLMLTFIAYTGLSVFLLHGGNPKETLSLISEKFDHIGLALIIYYVAKSTLKTEKQVSYALLALVTVGVYTAGFAFYEHYTGSMWFSSFIGGAYRLRFEDVGTGRACGPMLNPAAMGDFLGITAFVTFHFFAAAKNRAAKFLFISAVALQLVGCYFSYTRSGYLSAAVLLVLMPLFAQRYRKQYAGAALAVILVAMIAAPILMTDAGVHKRMTQDKTILIRMVVTASTINIIRHHPLFGVGLGGIDTAIDEYIVSAGSLSGLYARNYFPGRNNPSKLKLAPPVTSHNSILTVFAEQGGIGGGLFLGAILAFLAHLRAVRKRMPVSGLLGRDVISLLMIAAVGHLGSTMGYDIRFFRYPSYLLWMLFAIGVRLGEIMDERKRSEAADESPLSEPKGVLTHA